MKQIHLFFIVMLLFFTQSIVAQSETHQITTEGGLTVSYPDGWIYEDTGLHQAQFNHPEGWMIAVHIGTDADYSFSGNAYLTPAEILDGFREFMLMAETNGTGDPEPIDLGIIAGLWEPFSSNEGFNFEAFAYTLPDGMSALALVGNQSTGELPTEEIRDIFVGIFSSVTFIEPIIEEVVEEPTEESIYVPAGGTLIADLEPNTLRLSDLFETTYPEGWQIYTDNLYIRNNVTLLYGESVFNYEAMAVITVEHQANMTLAQFRQMILPISAALYTGNESFDPENDVVYEILPGGERILEYLDTTNSDTGAGNIYAMELEEGYWVWVMFTNLSTEDFEFRNEDVRTMLENMVFAPSEEETVTDGQDAEEKTGMVNENINLNHLQVTCEDKAWDILNETEPQSLVECPKGCGDVDYSIWGTDIYTADSSLCAAAIHTGIITNEEGGILIATLTQGQGEYIGTESNGISTFNYGIWGSSFEVEPYLDSSE